MEVVELLRDEMVKDDEARDYSARNEHGVEGARLKKMAVGWSSATLVRNNRGRKSSFKR